MRRENKKTMIFIGFILIIAVFFQIYVNKKGGTEEGVIAVLTINNNEVLKKDLLAESDGRISLSEYGVNGFLEIKNKKIAFKDVDCPEKRCEASGFLGKDNDIAVCMPNKMVLKIH